MFIRRPDASRSAKANAAELPWGEIGVDVVLECTGFYTSKEKAEAHLKAGAKKVVISAPAGNDLPTIVYNVNHETLTKANIGAKGLTGEAYNGNAFWDTETYCLPFFLFNNKEAAQNLLYFRYKTLDEARKRAKALDCEGAFYPIATISGRECCNLWQHASLQLQASTAVAYGIWFYEKLYHDEEFMTQYGLEMLIEISRMLVTRGDFSQDGKYGYYCVMGPDEFQMMVHNNCYTNFMGKFTLDFTLKVIEDIKKNDKKAYDEIVGKINFDESEMDKWKKVSEIGRAHV